MSSSLLIGLLLLILVAVVVVLRWVLLTGGLSSAASRRKELVEAVLDRMSPGNASRVRPKSDTRRGLRSHKAGNEYEDT
jgi:hypothetical protein